MRGTDERVALVCDRVRALDRRRERRELTGLSGLSATLTLALLGAISALSGSGHSPPPGQLAGASLLSDSAGGYVLVGAIAFAMGTAITLLCLKHRRQTLRDGSAARDWNEPVRGKRAGDGTKADKTMEETTV